MMRCFKFRHSSLLALLACFVMMPAMAATSEHSPNSNKQIVEKAMHGLFVNRDVSVVDRYWGKPYIQHNPHIPNGREALVSLVKSLPKNFRYEPGMIVAQGDLVMLHGRYDHFGPKPLDTVDIFRLKDGRIVEHWDVMQADVPASKTRSGNPMFSTSERSK